MNIFVGNLDFKVNENDLEEANRAIKELNGTNLKNRDLVVNEAKPKRND